MMYKARISEADEVTYNLHIILRFELEQAMLTGELNVADVPAAWNEKFEKMFDLSVPNDTNGCLQDTHWSIGAIGYFPTYCLGNLYAAQMFKAANDTLGDVNAQFEKGEFAPLLGWLRENVHQHGMRYKAHELIEKISGAPLSHEYLIMQLREKYGDIYGF